LFNDVYTGFALRQYENPSKLLPGRQDLQKSATSPFALNQWRMNSQVIFAAVSSSHPPSGKFSAQKQAMTLASSGIIRPRGRISLTVSFVPAAHIAVHLKEFPDVDFIN